MTSTELHNSFRIMIVKTRCFQSCVFSRFNIRKLNFSCELHFTELHHYVCLLLQDNVNGMTWKCFPHYITHVLWRESTWWRHQMMETFSALLALCGGNSPVTGEFPAQRPVTRSFDVFFRRLNKRWSNQSWGWWFHTPSRSLWRHRNGRSPQKNGNA